MLTDCQPLLWCPLSHWLWDVKWTPAMPLLVGRIQSLFTCQSFFLLSPPPPPLPHFAHSAWISPLQLSPTPVPAWKQSHDNQEKQCMVIWVSWTVFFFFSNKIPFCLWVVNFDPNWCEGRLRAYKHIATHASRLMVIMRIIYLAYCKIFTQSGMDCSASGLRHTINL